MPGTQNTTTPLLHAFLQGAEGDRATSLTPPALFPALAGFLDEQARQHPLCLFLDDLQWADEGTFAWLDFALSRPATAPIFWLGAYRREESASLAPLLERRSRWYRGDLHLDLGKHALARPYYEAARH